MTHLSAGQDHYTAANSSSPTSLTSSGVPFVWPRIATTTGRLTSSTLPFRFVVTLLEYSGGSGQQNHNAEQMASGVSVCLTQSPAIGIKLSSRCGINDVSMESETPACCRQRASASLECNGKWNDSFSFHDTCFSPLSPSSCITILHGHQNSNTDQVLTNACLEESGQDHSAFSMTKVSGLPSAGQHKQEQPFPQRNQRPPRAEGQRKHRRKAANDRERRRMTRINVAFDRLRTRLPRTPHRLSKHDTLLMALSYISELCSLLEVSHTGRCQSVLSVGFMLPCTPLLSVTL